MGEGTESITEKNAHFCKALLLPWKLYGKRTIKPTVLILDGNSDHVAHAQKKKGLFGEKISDL